MVLFGEWFEWLVTESWGSVVLSAGRLVVLYVCMTAWW